MAGFRSSASIATVCLVGDCQLGRFGGLKHLLRAIETSWIAAFFFIVAAGPWCGSGGNAVAAQSLLGTPRFSIVVLPFANLSGDPTQEPLADASSSKLTSALARLRGSLVIEQSTAGAYKDKPVDAKAIRDELRVRYVLKGSVQTTGDNTKVSAELIDAESGARLWDDQFDVPRAGAFDMQDKIAARLTRGIYLKLPEIQTAQFERTPASVLNAEDLAIECQAGILGNAIVFSETNTPCERALAADPENVLALTWSAFRLMPSLGRGHDSADNLKGVDALLSKALALDPNYAPAHLAKAFALQSQFRLDEAISEDRRAIELDPSLADAYWHMGFLLRRTCKYQMSLESIDEAIWLSPRDSFRSVWYADKAGSHIALKQYDQAIESARRAIAINPNKGSQHFYLVVALALAGEKAQAHEALQGYLAIVNPNRTLADWRVTRARTVNEHTDPCYVEYWNALFEGLRKAGAPEE
jgi:TolB-like protein/Tfp pilus assembly protein PilF